MIVKLSELIEELLYLKKEHGDTDVEFLVPIDNSGYQKMYATDLYVGGYGGHHKNFTTIEIHPINYNNK